ncbi:pseudouridine synthase [Shewanella corallii]|uniref:Pseudouridine synthase n=1 Tax=Shewanella corallii TaxID=560080 RepID=A0ABT0N237_9GAMM|nr:pseudouridine synthase [Shewanella corallii]MCL2912501.1 pseudouridine synthase [Shewanella corallii]
MRLAHYLAQCGVGSRRQCQRLITEGRVSFQGRVANHTDRLTLSCPQELMVDNQPIPGFEPKTSWLFHKPVGIDCRLQAHDPSSLLHRLPDSPRLYPVGRLDKDSRGLLLLTNHGDLTQRLMHPDFGHTKTYHVTVDRPFDQTFTQMMSAGVSYGEVTTLPCECRALDPNRFEIILNQGLNRQIRRMCKALGYRVIDLKRIEIMGQSLMDAQGIELEEGKMRPLTDSELTALILAVGL